MKIIKQTNKQKKNRYVANLVTNSLKKMIQNKVIQDNV